MMHGQNIVCFAKDWREDPTSNNHIMRVLARTNRVLWINSISTRTPSVKSGRDLKKIAAKLGQFARGVEQVEESLWVFTPIVLPLPHSRAAQVANRVILRQSLRVVRRRLGMDEFQLWSFLPTAAPYVGSLGESLAVYYCTDEFSEFPTVDATRIARMERDICERSDIVFVTADTLLESRLGFNARTHLSKHGVDHEHFARALDGSVDVAADLASLPQPVLGFFGLLHEWVDLGLIAQVARARPDWSIALIGQAAVDTSVLSGLRNVHLLGRRPYAELPSYCKGFSVALIPFVVNELTRHVNPIKLREYASAGLPVVSTPLPEVRHYRDCYLGDTPDGFVTAIERALSEDSAEARRTRSEAMREETWERKVEQLGDRVLNVRRRHRR
jgi:glycosyltransferase involved in cell wall biosynthesis